MNSIEWDNLLARSWKHSYPQVHVEAKRLLDTLAEGVTMTTTELVEALYPEAQARGDMIVRRQKMFKALRAGIEHRALAAYWSPGPGKRYMGKTIYPPVWHKRDPKALQDGEIECPVCGSHFVPETGRTGGGHAR